MSAEELNARIAAVRAGDMTAFEDIYAELNTPVYTIIVRMTCDTGMAEDILQEVFIKLYRSPPKQSVRDPRAYIFKMAHNLAIDSMRKRRPDVSLEALDDMIPGPEQDHTLKLDLEAAMQRLTSLQRQIITLHINGGLTFREIADIVGAPLGTVLWRYQAAVSKLRNYLSGGVT